MLILYLSGSLILSINSSTIDHVHSLDHATTGALLCRLQKLHEGGPDDEEEEQTEHHRSHWHLNIFFLLLEKNKMGEFIS